jgi:hypothetical protein
MSVNFSNPVALLQGEIDYFVQGSGVIVPEKFKKYLQEFNGAQPRANVFSIDEKNESGVNKLIPVSQMIEEQKYLENVFPIAWLEGGNYVVVDFDKNASIYFWDHEEPENPTLLGSDVYDFLSKLKPFDPDSVELKEGQVESAWIDPDFLKSLK